METKSKDKTALVFGYTGLTGKALTNQLLMDDRYSVVKIFVRHPVENLHPKIKIIVDDLTDLARITSEIKGDELYCCLGTTMKKAGSKDAFKRVDYGLPVKLAEIAYSGGVGKFLVISSIGANPGSKNFYLQTKGKMEAEVSLFNFRQLSIFRPSFLMGRREEFRFGEELGKVVSSISSVLLFGPLKKYRGIKASTVARAMIRVANNIPSGRIYQSDEIAKLGSPGRK